MKTLNQLVEDNRLINTDKGNAHSYLDFYEKEFFKYKYREIVIVEIGILTGDSIKLWDLYFDQVSIYGLDVIDNSNFKPSIKEKNKIQYIIGDAYSEEIKDLIPNFDILIDDGPHTLDSQLKSIELYIHKMNPGGVFIIEDIQDFNHLEILKNHLESLVSDMTVEFIDLRNLKNRYDDLLFVVRKN